MDLFDVRRRTETMICLAMTEYEFTYVKPSILATTSLLILLQNYSELKNMSVVESGKDYSEVQESVLDICNVEKVTWSIMNFFLKTFLTYFCTSF